MTEGCVRLGDEVTAERWSGGIELDALVDTDGVGGTTVACEDGGCGGGRVCTEDDGATAAAATFAYPAGGFRGGAGALTILATDCCAKLACGGGFGAGRNGQCD